jgi:hypothetical protein
MKAQQQVEPQRKAAPAARQTTPNPGLEHSNSMGIGPVGLSDTELLRGPVSDLSKNPEVTKDDKGKYDYKEFKGTAFARGKGDAQSVAANDVEQNYLGDCYLIAAMGAVARAQPGAIKDLIKDNKDGTYDVSLWVPKSKWSQTRVKTTVTVDSQFPATAAGAPAYAGKGDTTKKGPELWPMLLEKAYAIYMGSYGAIEGGYSGDSMEMLTNKESQGYDSPDLGDDELMDLIAGALKNKQSITAEVTDEADWSDADKKEAEKYGIIGNHAYAPSKASKKAKTIDLQNPWGINHITGLPVKVFKKFFTWFNING